MAEIADRVVRALRDVYDPCCRERGISVVDMGLVEDVRVSGDRAAVELVLTSGWCPFAVQLLDEVREAVAGLDDVGDAEVTVTWDTAWSAERLSDDARAKLRFLPDPAQLADRDAYVAAHRPQPATTPPPSTDEPTTNEPTTTNERQQP